MTQATKDLVSVIIPVYNVEKYLPKCLDSVINQTHRQIEIILIDDGSTDSSGEICDKYAKNDKRIKVYHKKNGGLSDARNYGIEKNKNEWICFVDSDDYIDSDYVKKMYDVAKRFATDIAISDPLIEYSSGKKISYSTYKEYVETPEQFFYDMLYAIRDIDNSAVGKLYKSHLFEGIKYPCGKNYEDTATTYKVIDRCEKIAVTSYPLYHYAKRDDSITQDAFNPKKMQLIDAVKQLTEYVSEKYPKLQRAADRKMAWAYMSTLSQLSISDKRYPKIEEQLMSGLKKYRRTVLFDSMTPKRDKIGLFMSIFGFSCYQKVWRLYIKKSKRG